MFWTGFLSTFIIKNGIKSYNSANFTLTTMTHSNLIRKSEYSHHYLKCKLIYNIQSIYKLQGCW